MVNKVYALAVRYTQSSAPCENVLHIEKITAGDPSAAQFLTIANLWKDKLRVSQSSTVAWSTYVATQVSGDGVTYNSSNGRQLGGTITQGVLTGTLAGSSAVDALPPMATASLNVHSGLRGRAYRTKIQCGGFPEDAQTQGFWQAAITTTLQAAINAFLGVYGSGGTDPDFRWVTFSRGVASGWYPNPDDVHHRLIHRTDGNPAIATAPVVTATYNQSVSTTRSRIVR